MSERDTMSVGIPLVLAVLFLGLAPSLMAAQDRVAVPRLSGPVALDGVSDEPAWDAVDPLPVVVHTPDFGAEPSERTEIRFAHDGEHLYVAGRLYDSEPERIRSNTLRRDEGRLQSDIFALVVDSYNDNETAFVFGTTPAGIRVDAAVSNDAEGSAPVNFSWDTFWDVETARTDEGWFAEYRIPFSSLRFQTEGGRVTMGVLAWRWIPRKNEMISSPEIPPNWGIYSILKPSQAQDVVLEGVRREDPVYVTPYALGGLGQSFPLAENAAGYDELRTPAREVGLDVKYGITSNLTLDVTANTDFAQVEADQQQVNLTRFSLFFPEKRPFFQERASIFEFRLGGFDRLFYSRRIGLHQGEQVPIYGGARLSGRVGGWDVGLMNMQTASAGPLASENFGVVRLRRRVLNENSYVGGIVTSRVGADGAHNLAYGLDGVLRLFGQDYLTLNWVQIFKDGTVPTSTLDRSVARANWERRGVDGLGYAFSVKRVGEAAEPGIGFLLRRDYTRIGDKISYGWRPGEGSGVFRHTVALNGAAYRRNGDGTTESASVGPEWQIARKSGHKFTLGADLLYEDIRRAFELSPEARIPAGSYRFYNARLGYTPPQGAQFSSAASLEAGSFYDGWRLTAGVRPTWSVSRHLELGGGYEFNRIAFPTRDQRFDAHVARLRARAMMSTQLTAGGFMQYNSATDAVIANVRFRYNPREGNDLYIVYNHGLDTSRYGLDSTPLSRSRTVLLKYSHTFTLGF